MSPRAKRTVVYTLLGILVWFIVWRQGETVDELHAFIAAEAAEDEVEEAQACIDQWERVPQLREVIEVSVREGSAAGAGAVFDVAAQVPSQPFPPEAAPLLEAAVDERVRDAVDDVVSQYPDPTCSLPEAESIVSNQEKP